MFATCALVLGLTLGTAPLANPVMVEQFYFDHTGKRVSRAINHSPIDYGPQDQMFYFLGHFGFVDTLSFRQFSFPCVCECGVGDLASPFVVSFVPTDTALVNVNTALVDGNTTMINDDIATSVAVIEPRSSMTILIMALMFLFVARQLTVDRHVL